MTFYKNGSQVPGGWERPARSPGPLLWSRDQLETITGEKAAGSRGEKSWVSRTVVHSMAESYFLY